MTKQVSDNVPQGPTCGQFGSIPCDKAGYRLSGGKPGEPSQTSKSPAVPVVVLVEHRDDVFDRLIGCFTTAGFRVVRATSSSDAIKWYVSEPADLLVVNSDQPRETAWLLVGKLHLTHPAARTWVYIRRPSASDVAAANMLAIEELIEYDGEAAELQIQILNRLGVSSGIPVPCCSSPVGIVSVEAAA